VGVGLGRGQRGSHEAREGGVGSRFFFSAGFWRFREGGFDALEVSRLLEVLIKAGVGVLRCRMCLLLFWGFSRFLLYCFWLSHLMSSGMDDLGLTSAFQAGFKAQIEVCHLEAAECGAHRDATRSTYLPYVRAAHQIGRRGVSRGSALARRSGAMKHLAGICRL